MTLQSSTESAQDTYLDQQDHGSEANSHSGRSNSSDSLCSTHTGSLAKGTKLPPVPVPAAGSAPPVPAPRDLPTTPAVSTTTSTSTQSQNVTLSFGITLEQPPTAPKRKLSSIGVQVRFVHNAWWCIIMLHLTEIFFSFGDILGGLSSTCTKWRTCASVCTSEVSVNWSSSGKRQAVSLLHGCRQSAKVVCGFEMKSDHGLKWAPKLSVLFIDYWD